MEGSCVGYEWQPGVEYDVIYFSRVFGLTLTSKESLTDVPPLDESVTMACLRSSPCPPPILTQLQQLAQSGHLSSTKKTSASADKLFRETRDLLFLFPCPVYSSPLGMALDAASDKAYAGTPILMNSFDVLHKLCRFERIVFRASKLSESEKARIQTARDRFLHRLAQFSRLEGGLHHCLQMTPPPNLETERAFIKENFFTSVNCIRVLEFTILDYLGVPEPEQSSYGTYAAATLPKSVAIKAACWDSIRKSLKSMAAAAGKEKEIDLCTVQTGRFIPPAMVSELWTDCRRKMTAGYVFPCSRKGCTKMETADQRFPRCSRCGWCRYCTKTCQTEHWKAEHKERCGKTIDLSVLDSGRILIGGHEETDANA